MPNGPLNTHFWTTDPNGELLPKPPFATEGIAFYAYRSITDAPGLIPVYRFYDSSSDLHFWTTDPKGEQLGPSFPREGVAFFVPSASSGTIPVYRFYDGGSHHFWTTASSGELLQQPPFRLEGAAFQALPTPAPSSIGVWRFHSPELPVGQIIQEGPGYKEIVIGPGWQWINTYVNLDITARVSGEAGRPYEIASGFVWPWNDTGPNKQQGKGPMQIDMGPFGQLHARSLDGAPVTFGYHDIKVSVQWKQININF